MFFFANLALPLAWTVYCACWTARVSLILTDLHNRCQTFYTTVPILIAFDIYFLQLFF